MLKLIMVHLVTTGTLFTLLVLIVAAQASAGAVRGALRARRRPAAVAPAQRAAKPAPQAARQPSAQAA